MLDPKYLHYRPVCPTFISTSIRISTTEFIKGLKAALSDVSVIDSLKTAICQPMLDELEQLRETIKMKDDLISKLEEKVDLLEAKQDETEQYSRRNSLRISGLPEKKDENLLQSLPDLLNREARIDPPIKPEDICRVHRVGRVREDKKPRQVILKMATYQARACIYKHRTHFKQFPSLQSVYINEDLTQRRSRLLYQARLQKKEKRITDAWTKDGNIFIKALDGKISHIKSETQLND